MPRLRTRLVVVEAHLAVIDRRHAVLVVEDVPVDHAGQPGRLVRVEESPSSARERRLPSTEDHVALRVAAVRRAFVSISLASPIEDPRVSPPRLEGLLHAFDTANESCVTSTTSVAPLPPPHPLRAEGETACASDAESLVPAPSLGLRPAPAKTATRVPADR
jgi:hypothetical protein